MITVITYSESLKEEWDKLVDRSQSPHFMLKRDYIEYHADRFVDASLIFFNEKQEVVAVLPGNIKDTSFYSHQGLSFGGLLYKKNLSVKEIEEIICESKQYIHKSLGLSKMIYKKIPWIYSDVPTGSDEYLLIRDGAKLIRRDLTTTIDYSERLPAQKMRLRNAKKAEKNELIIRESSVERVWSVIESVLKEQHGTKPVHSKEEMAYLYSKFPENIRIYAAEKNKEATACVVIYETNHVAHAQYIANSEQGRKIGALDLLFLTLIDKYSLSKKYFDFGISTENSGKTLNYGLITQKEGFGGRGFTHDFYEICLK